jgi:cardiolipin synthase
MPSSLPNLLTFSRILVIPVIVGLFWVEGNGARWIACLLFTLAGVTDYLDGYLARSWRQQSQLGMLLDPIADKLLVGAALMALAGFGRIHGLLLLPAIVILCREILVSGLREYLAELRVSVPVTRLAKWKTTLQLIAIGFLIAGDAGDAIVPVVTWTGIMLLWLSALLTIYTGWDYLQAGLHHLTREDA